MDKLVVGKVIMMPAMRRGLCGYADETVLLSQDTLKQMSETVHGIPVVVDHQIVDTDNVEKLTVGRVADMHYNEETDNWNVHFVVDSQDAVDKLQSGWGVSTAYLITDSGPGGTLNNVPYNREVTGAKYDHLAIVQNPRYEMAKNPVFYNSKGELSSPDILNTTSKRGGSMLGKLWRTIREEVKINEGDELFVVVNGKEMLLNDLTSAVHEAEMKKNQKKVIMNEKDIVEYNGEKMPVEKLVNMYNSFKAEEKKNMDEKAEKEKCDAKKNEEKEVVEEKKNEDEKIEEKKNEDEKVEEKKNEDEKKEEKEEKKEEKKENTVDVKEQANFDELRSIKENGVTQVSQWQSLSDRLEAGRKLFGSK